VIARRASSPGRRLAWPRRLGLWALNLAAIAFLVGPLGPVVLVSLQSEKSLQQDLRALLPREYTLANFRLILTGGAARGPIFEQVSYLPKSVERFPGAFVNSLIVGGAVTAVALAAASLSAYTIARMGLGWPRALLRVSVAARMVPLVVLMVPLYVMFRRYGLLNSLWGVIIAEVGFLLPYAVLILAPYLASLPAELEDAARIDGCTRFGAFWRIVLPLATPGLAACAVILFVISWHELLIPLIVVSRPEFMTLPVVLSGLVSDYFVFFTLMMAICLLGLLPTVALVLLLQRYIVRGLVAGAIKG
jgi:multiple sugar transport system permease protein